MLMVCQTWPQPPEVEEAIDAMVVARGGCVIRKLGHHLDHGMGLDMLIPMIRDDHEIVLFMEDDLYVREPNALEHITAKVESGVTGLVGARRWNGSLELQDIMHRRGLSGLWPHLLIAKTTEVKAVREHWGAHLWQKGERIRPLQWRTPGVISSDTAMAATMELQLRRSCFEIDSPNVEVADTNSEWFHIGSLSTGPLPHPHGGVRPLDAARDNPDSWAQRVAWWKRTLKRSVPGMENLYERHLDALDALERACGPARVMHWRKKYEALVTWPE
jgi:hypothetical protein